MIEKPKVKGRILGFYRNVKPLSGLTLGEIYALLLRYYEPAAIELSILKDIVLDLINEGYLRKEALYLDADTILFATEKAYLLIDKKRIDETIELPRDLK